MLLIMLLFSSHSNKLDFHIKVELFVKQTGVMLQLANEDPTKLVKKLIIHFSTTMVMDLGVRCCQ